MSNLITPYEAAKYSPAGKDYPTKSLCAFIPQIEEEFARECLGEDLYDYLVEHLSPYPAGTLEWDESQSGGYDIDDTVEREGCLFVSLTDNNEADPLSETGDWAAFERFDDDGCNQLWTRYLRQILALKTFAASLVFVTWRSGAGGVSVNVGDAAGNRSGNQQEMSNLKSSAQKEIERATENMLAWLTKNAVELGLPTAPSCAGVCETPGRGQRRFATRTQYNVGQWAW